MQANQTIMYPPPMPAPAAPSFIEGDPATRQFGMVFLGTLALLTIGVGLGIGLGNISHARYYGPYDTRNITLNQTTNISDILPKWDVLSVSNAYPIEVKRSQWTEDDQESTKERLW